MPKGKRYYGLKANGQITVVYPSDHEMTVEDFTNYDTTLHYGVQYEVVECSVKQIRKVNGE